MYTDYCKEYNMYMYMYTDYCKEYNMDLRSDAYLILP